jgi:pimeloyl-ACP methyl ester carboxylesterase
MPRWSVWGIACGLLLGLTPGLRAQDKTFDSNGVKIRYTDQGKGEPVLLIHGFTANVEMQWGLPGVLKALAKDYRVIAYDNRGHGKSGKPHHPGKYGAEMVEDAVRLLDHLKVKKAHVVGYSMGAMIAAKLQATHPDRLLSVTLGGAGPVREDNREMAQLMDKLADSLEKGKGFGPLLEALTPKGKPKPPPERLKEIEKLLTTFNDPKALAAVARGFKMLSVSDAQLKANRVPTLALIGKDDPLKKGVDDVKGQLAGLEVVVIPGDHITAFSQPEFIRGIQAFLEKHRAGGKAKESAGK